ncbi:MAG: hypothetical protein JNM72_08580 [Deltaproteobacteria bacterium]|jgi:hypothetical protein|nr:hypothetical protein [Deltaproteobacteria bacterium]
MTAHQLLTTLDPWLNGRSEYLAARLPGLGADEIYQRVVHEFLTKLERWLQQDATVDVVAQARTLMVFCLRHVETSELRHRKRQYDLADDEDAEALERVAEPVRPVDNAAARELLAQLRGSTSPPCALCLLSMRLPLIVEEDDAKRAKDWTKGGSNAVPRALDEAWGIYTAGTLQPGLVADDIAWKDLVGVAWYTTGAVESVSVEDRRSASVKVERYANRAADDLRKALLYREGET